MKKLSKKSKIISLGAISTIALAIVPATIVACSSESNDSKDMNNFISSFKNNTFNIAVLNAASISPSAIPTSLTSSNIGTYFSNIPAAPSGITLVYSANADDVIGTITLNVSASQSGFATQNASITFSGLLSTNQSIINNFINAFNNSTNNPKTIIAGVNTVATNDMPTTITGTNISQYFTNLPTVATGSTSSIALSYTISNISAISGQVSLSVSASAANALTVVSDPITVNGFMTSHQVNQNTLEAITANLQAVILNATKTATAQKPIDVYNALHASSLTLASFIPYFNTTEIQNIISDILGLNATYSINPVSSSLSTSGQISINVNLSLGTGQSQASKNINLIVNGFISTKLTDDQMTQLANLNVLATKLSELPLNASTPTAPAKLQSPSEVYEALKNNSSLALNDFSTYFSTSTISDAINAASTTTNPITATYTLIQPTTTNLTNGTFNVLVTLTSGTGDSAVTTIATLNVTGFANSNQAAVEAYIQVLQNVSNIRGNNTIEPTKLPATTNLSWYLTNLPVLTNNNLTITYLFSNFNDNFGSADLVISVSAPGVTPVQSQTISVSGFLNNDQATVNKYVTAINANYSLITGYDTQLPSTLSASTIGKYLKGLPANPDNVNLTYKIISFNNVTGTVTLSVIVSSLNAIAQTSNNFTVNGFKIQTMQSLLSSIKASDFNFSIPALLPDTTIVNGTFTKLPTWLQNSNASVTELISGLPFSLIKSYTISDWNPAFGDANITILANDGFFTKVLLTNIGNFYTSNIGQINFSAKALAISPKTFDKNIIPINSNLSTIFNTLGINITSTTSSTNFKGSYMFPYVTGYQLNYVSTSTTDNSITLSITLDFTNPFNKDVTTNTYNISGTFLPSTTNPLSVLNTSLKPGSFYGNYWSTTNNAPGLGNNATSNSLYIPSTTTSGDFEFKSNAVIAASGTTLPDFITNINWPAESGYTNESVVSWTEVGNNTTGIATYTLTLKDSKTATLAVSGFMTTANAITLAGLGVNKLANISSLPVPSNGTVANTTERFANVGVSGIIWNNLNTSLFGGGINFYSIANPNPSTGTANWLFHFYNGVVLSVPISGYSTNPFATSITITPKSANTVAPSNGPLTITQAQQYFNFSSSTPNIESTFKTIVVSNSNSTGSVNLTITNNNDISVIFPVTGFLNVVLIVDQIQSLITFQNNSSTLLNLATIFPNGQNLVITAAQILNSNIPNWVIVPEEAKTLITELISSGIAENTININIKPFYQSYISASYLNGNFSTPSMPLWTTSAGNYTSSSTTGFSYLNLLFESAQQYLNNNNLFKLTLNKNILKKETLGNFVQILSSTNNSYSGTNFMGTIQPNGNFTGGYDGNSDNMGTSSNLYTDAQWSTITSLFNISLKPNLFGWNLNNVNSGISWNSLVNIVVQQQTNGLVVRAYLGWNIYVDTFIPNSDFITPSIGQMVTNNIVTAVVNNIANNQPLSLFTNNQPISFDLNNIPSWITLTQAQISTIIGSSGYLAKDINVTIELPSYPYPSAANSTNSNTTAQISVSINGVANSTSIGSTSSFEPAITLFQKVTSISLNSSLLNNITVQQFMNQYVIPNGFIIGANNLSVLKQMFNINIMPTWFNQWNINNITYAQVLLTADGSSVTVKIYIQSNISNVITIPANMFKHDLNTNETMTSNIAKSISSNITNGTLLSNFTNNQPISFNLNNIPSWITNQTDIKALVTDGQDLGNVIVTITLPQYLYTPNPDNTTNSSTTVQISVSIKNGETLQDTSYTVSNNFQSARSYFQSITTLTLQDAYKNMSNTDLWAAIRPTALTSTSGTSDLTLIQKFFNININNPMFLSWNLNNITSVKVVNNVSGIQITINMQANIWTTIVVAANAQSQIANAISQNVASNTSLTEFKNNAAITFNLANIPSWITNQVAILALVPSGINASDVSVSFALPTIIPYSNGSNVTSMTFSVITVTIDGTSATATTNNFQSAQEYLQSITTISLRAISTAMTYANFWTNVAVAQGWNGGSGNNPNEWFQITIPSTNVFNWNANSFAYWVVATQLPGNILEMKFLTQSNVWVVAYFDSSLFASPTPSSTVSLAPATDRLV